MRILVNTGSTFKGGAVQVAHSFINECVNFPNHEYLVLLGPKLSSMISQSTFPSNFQFIQLEKRTIHNLLGSILGNVYNEIEYEFKPDCVFTTSGPSYWSSLAPQLIGFNLPHYIYHESPFFDKEGFVQRLKWKLRGYGLKYFFRRDGDAFVCQTDDVTERVKSFLGVDRVTTVSNTYNSVFKESQLKTKGLLLPSSTGKFRMLMLSAFHKHKNFEIIPKVISELTRKGVLDFEFVLTIPPGDYEFLFGKNGDSHVFNLGPISINQCPQLYKEVNAMFLPTLLECFSASYPEAMISDRPILTSDLGFAKTVCGDAALYFDPVDATNIADVIIKIKNDYNLQRELVELGKNRLSVFNTSRQRAEKFLKLCESMNLEKNSGIAELPI